MASGLGFKLGIEGEREFKSALADINRDFKVLGSEMKLVQSQFDKNDNSVEALTARNEVLNKQIDAQKDKISTLKAALDNAAASFGENDKRTQNWKIQLNNAEAALNGMERQINQNNEAIRNASSDLSDAEKAENEFKKSLNEINQVYRVLGSEMELVQSQFDKNDNSVEALTARNTVLNKQIDAQKEKILTLKNALKNSAESFGENDKQTQEWQIKLNKAESALNTMERELKNNNAQLEKTDDDLEKAGDEAEKFGKESEKAGDKFSKLGDITKTVVKAIVASVAAIGAAAVAAGKKLWDMANDVAETGDEIDKMSQKIGISAESYQEWDYVFQRSGTDIKNLQAGMKTLSDVITDAGNGSDKAAAKLSAVGLSVKDLAGKSQDEQLSMVIARLQQMESGAARTSAATDLLGKSATDMAAVLNMTAEETAALKKEAQDYGMVMSDEAVKASAAFEDSLTKLKGTVSGFKNRMIGDLLPGITLISDGFADLVAGNKEAGEEIKNGVSSVIETITDMIPQAVELLSLLAEAVLESAPAILSALTEGIIEVLPGILPQLFDTLFELIDSLLFDGLPKLFSALKKIASSLFDKILEQFPVFINKLIEFIGSIDLGEILRTLLNAVQRIATMLADNLPTIVQNLMEAIINLFNSIDWKELIQVSFQILRTLARGILEAIPVLIDALPDLISAIVDALTDPETIMELVKGGIQLVVEIVKHLPQIVWSLLQAIVKLGGQLIEGLWEGIKKMGSWLWDKISGFFSGLWDNILGFFGVHSPSTLFRDGLGKNLALGLGLGFTDEMENVSKEMQDAIPKSFDTDIRASVSGGFDSAGQAIGGSPAYNVYISFGDVTMASDMDIEDVAHRVSDVIVNDIYVKKGAYA